MTTESHLTTGPGAAAVAASIRPDDHRTISGAGRHDLPVVVALAERTGAWLPWATWMAPDGEDRDSILHAGYTVLAELALTYGSIDMLGDQAAAIWLDRTAKLALPTGRDRPRMVRVCGPHFDLGLALLDLTAAHRPARGHLHLAALAAPRADDATALLAYRHRRLDRAGVLAYAETSNEHHVALLTAAGYEPGEAFRLSAGPSIRPLTRIPAASRQAGQGSGSAKPASACVPSSR